MRATGGTGRLLAAASCAALALAACSSASTSPDSATATGSSTAAAAAASEDLVNPDAVVEGPITIGYLDYPSSRIMAEVYGKALDEAGFQTQLTVAGTNADFLRAMAAGKVDVVPEFVGPFAEALNVAVNGPDAEPQEQVDLATSQADARELARSPGAHPARRHTRVGHYRVRRRHGLRGGDGDHDPLPAGRVEQGEPDAHGRRA